MSNCVCFVSVKMSKRVFNIVKMFNHVNDYILLTKTFVTFILKNG